MKNKSIYLSLNLLTNIGYAFALLMILGTIELRNDFKYCVVLLVWLNKAMTETKFDLMQEEIDSLKNQNK